MNASDGRDASTLLLPSLPGLAAAPARGAPHAGVEVLSSSMLFDLVTSFMPGYPYAVYKFSHDEKTNWRLRDQRRGDFTHTSALSYPVSAEGTDVARRGSGTAWPFTCGYGRQYFLRKKFGCWCHGDSTEEKVLPHLAIAANDSAMLQLLHRVSQRPEYRGDPKLSFARVMRCAVNHNRVDMLECINELKVSDPDWEWEPLLMRTALQQQSPGIPMLDWLFGHLPRDTYTLSDRDMLHFVKTGNLESIKWLHSHRSSIPQSAINEAARRGDVRALRFFFQHSHKRCGPEALFLAAGDGRLEIVKFIVEDRQKKTTYRRVINHAAGQGQLAVVKYFIETKNHVVSPNVIDCAAAAGHLEIVKYLHEKCALGGGCTDQAIGNAAAIGRMDIITFLHEHRAEGCSPDALDRAARNGHVEVVAFLHETYSLDCSADGFEAAAASGHLEVVDYLFRNCTEGSIENAVAVAIDARHLVLARFLATQESIWGYRRGCGKSMREDLCGSNATK